MPRPNNRRDWDDEDEDDRPRRRRRDEDDEDEYEDDRPRPRRRPRSRGGNGMAVAALVLGILSLFCTFVTGIPAVIFGVLGLTKSNKTGSGKGMAIAGMILGVAGTIVAGTTYYYLYIKVKEGVATVREKLDEASGGLQSNNNMRRITTAAHQYHDRMSEFPRSYHVSVPPPATLPPDSSRLSWRVTLLPNLNQQMLYSRFKGDEAWNSPTNRPASDTYVPEYGDTAGSTQTRYRVFVGGGALFDADPPQMKGAPIAAQMARPSRITGVLDGTANTIFCVEATETVPWAQHKEFAFNPDGPLPSFGRAGTDTFVVAMCDGSTRFVKKTVDPKVMKGAITRAGGEVLPWDW